MRSEVMKRKNLWQTYSEAQLEKLEKTNALYRVCLDEGKTERECVQKTIELARAQGYEDMKQLIKAGKKIRTGDKVYMDYMGKAIVLFHAGTAPVEEGMNILGAHIDSPRIDVKQNPLYENEGLAFLDTHYYGGIKKYQWLSIPLALHGVVIKKNGKKVEVCVGEKETDPVLVINDLLPHLGAKQREKLAKDFIDGEQMDLLIGNRPEDGEEDAVTRRIRNLLKEKYDIEEEDFLSAELEIVPAGRARECGLDNSMILACDLCTGVICTYGTGSDIPDPAVPDCSESWTSGHDTGIVPAKLIQCIWNISSETVLYVIAEGTGRSGVAGRL